MNFGVPQSAEMLKSQPIKKPVFPVVA